jgi:hypothetical protein
MLYELNLYEAANNTLLRKVIIRSPGIKSLTIRHLMPGTPPSPSPLPKFCMPELQSLNCPPCMASSLVPGWPLHNIAPAGTSYANRVNIDSCSPPPPASFSLLGRADLETLTQTSVPIRILRMPVQFLLAGAPTRHFSGLKEPHLDFHHKTTADGRRSVGVNITKTCAFSYVYLPSAQT